MRFIKKHPLFTLFILGFFLRVTLPFLDYSWDVNNHIAWAKDLWQRGFAGFYETQSSEVYATLYPNYPPLSIFSFYLVYPLQLIIYKIAWWLNLTIPLFPSNLIFFLQKRAFLAAMFKLPAIFADLGIAWLCYLFAIKILPKNKKIHLFVLILVLFNPAFFFNSALWGQIDIIPIFFVLISYFLLINSPSYILSTATFVFALLVKPTALVYLPVYIAFFIHKHSLLKLLKAAIVSNFIFWLSFLPFLKNSNNLLLSYTIYSEKILAAQSLPFVTNGAFNFWTMILGFTGIKDTALFILGFSYRMWGYLIISFFTVLVLYSFATLRHSGERKRLQNRFWTSLNDIFCATFLISFAAFLFLTKMHERYSLLPLPFLLLASVKNQKLLKWFIILSLISFINHYHSWPVPKIEMLFTVISNPLVVIIFSLFNVILFLYLLVFYLTSFWQARNERVQNRFWSQRRIGASPE